jgi:PAS domain S-box-containing protein
MQWQHNPYILPLAAAAIITSALALLGWRRRPARGAGAFAWLMLAAAEWSLVYALELASADLGTQIFWAKVEYLGIASIPLAWLVLALRYTGRDKWLTPVSLALLGAVPVATLMLAWTNEVHGLMWSDIQQEASVGFSVMALTYGTWWWVNFAYAYLLLLGGTALFFQVLLRRSRLYRGQAGALLVGALAPWIGNAIYVAGLSPFPHLDLTPLSFALSGLPMALGLFGFRLLDVVLVARDAVIEGISDGVIVVDIQDRIVDLNPAAVLILGRPAESVVGFSLTEALSEWPDLADRCAGVPDAFDEVVFGKGKVQRAYELRISTLYNREGDSTGRLFVFHDVAERRQAEEVLRVRALQFQTAAEVARDASSVRDPGELLSNVANLICERFHFYHVGVFLVDEQGDWAVLRAATGEGGRRMLARAHRLRVGGPGIVGYVTGSGLPRIALDVDADAVYLDNPDLPRTRSEVALPLRVRGQVIGALDVQSQEPEAFSDDDVVVLETLADQVAMAISNARLLQQVQDSLEAERRAYGGLTRQAWQSALRSRPDLGVRRHAGGIAPTSGLRRPETMSALRTGGRVFSEGDDRRLAVPIKVRDHVIGVVNARKPAGSTGWVPAEVDLLETLVEQLGAALDDARLYQDSLLRAERERVIGEVTARMRATLDVDSVLQTAVREIGESLGIQEVEVRLNPGGSEERRS